MKFLKLKNNSGQATIEAAVMIPVIFLLLLLLIQPGILLYDKMIMISAASECTRVLSTCSEENKTQICDSFLRRRLSAIPQQDNFHVHSSDCSYKFDFIGNQSSDTVEVKVRNEVKPIPLIGFLSGILGILNSNDNFELNVSANCKTRPEWCQNSPLGSNVERWVGGWLN